MAEVWAPDHLAGAAGDLLSSFDIVGLPARLHQVTIHKISAQIFDAGSTFTFASLEREQGDDDGDIEITTSKYALCASRPLLANEDVFLIDHMWTTTFPQCRSTILTDEILRTRLESCFGIERTSDNMDNLWSILWTQFGCYSIRPDDYTRFFILDEVGLSISHSDTPNVAFGTVIIKYGGGGDQLEPAAYSFFWPVQDIAEGELITRDFLSAILPSESKRRNAFRLALYKQPPRSLATDDGPRSKYAELVKRHIAEMQPIEADIVPGRKTATVSHTTSNLCTPLHYSPRPPGPQQPGWDVTKRAMASVIAGRRLLKVFCDRIDHISKELIVSGRAASLPSSSECIGDGVEIGFSIEVVESAADADALYLIEHMNDDATEVDKRNKVTNQFWWNGLLVSKDALAETVKKAYRAKSAKCKGDAARMFVFPTWLPVTYNLSPEDEEEMNEEREEARDSGFELTSFLADFITREEAGDDNVWILKKVRGRQSIDYPITDNLACVLRHIQHSPRVACKYISRPVLLSGKKFDLRYYVIVKSLRPLVLRRHRLFVVRCANRRYSLTDLEDYQKHFTLMNLLDDEAMAAVRGEGRRSDPNMDEFIAIFDEENRSKKKSWREDVQPAIDDVIRNVFQCVEEVCDDEALRHTSGEKFHPNAAWSVTQPANITFCPGSMFGIDIMVRDKNSESGGERAALQPVVLEVQWGPDCTQAVKYVPTFWDEILAAVFLDDTANVISL